VRGSDSVLSEPEGLTAACRADMICHWEDCDTVAQEVYANVCVLCGAMWRNMDLLTIIGLFDMYLYSICCQNMSPNDDFRPGPPRRPSL
jgi:hypothetical protein